MEEYLGKIKAVSMGYVGCQSAQFGFQFEIGGKDWGVTTPLMGTWRIHRVGAKWTKEEQIQKFGKALLDVADLLDDADVTDIRQLVGKPVRAYFEKNTLRSWEILKEVI